MLASYIQNTGCYYTLKIRWDLH